MVSQALKNQIEEITLDCLCKAEDVFRHTTFPMIEIRYDLKGKTAGQHCKRGGHHYLRINEVLLNENTEDYLKQVVPHEVAHYVVSVAYANTFRKVQSHGVEWKGVMSKIFGLSADRCHSFDVSNNKRRMRKHHWKCDCRTHKFSARRHNKYLRLYQVHRFPIGYVLNASIYCKYCKNSTWTYQGSRVD